MNKKILVLHCGGTISCEEKDGVLCPISDISHCFEPISSEMNVAFVHRRIDPFLSEHLDGEKLNCILGTLNSAVKEDCFDGILITHGSDTVQYTAAFLDLALGTGCIPTVLVCADLPMHDPRSAGHKNLRDAACLILDGSARGVFAVYDGTVHRGSRLLAHRTYENTLSSAVSDCGKIVSISPENRVWVKNKDFHEDERSALACPVLTKISPVMLITATPGMRYPAPARGIRAFILNTYHSGTIDTLSKKTKRFAKQCMRRKIPVYVGGIGANADYKSMTEYEKLGFKRLSPLSSPICEYMRAWMELGSKAEKEENK